MSARFAILNSLKTTNHEGARKGRLSNIAYKHYTRAQAADAFKIASQLSSAVREYLVLFDSSPLQYVALLLTNLR